MEPVQDLAACPWAVPAAPRTAEPVAAIAAEGPRHPFCLLCSALNEDPPGPLPSGPAGLPAAVRVPLRAEARLFERGTLGDAVYVLQSGIVKEVTASPDGSECIVRLVVRGGICGLGALLRVPHSHSAYVLHPGQACRIPVQRLERLREQDPHVVDRLFADWQRAVDDADRIIGELCQGPARARLARALLLLRGVLEPGEALRVKRDDLAQMLAVNPATVARLLGEFRRAGLIEQRGRYCVAIDRARLQQLSIHPT